MKTKNLIFVIIAAGSMVACSTESKEEKNAESNKSEKSSGTKSLELNTPPNDINPSKKMNLKTEELPKLDISIGLPEGYSAKFGVEFDDLISYTIVKDDVVLMQIFSKAVMKDLNNGKFPMDPQIIQNQYDAQSTNFTFLEKKKTSHGNLLTGVVFSIIDDEDKIKRFEYFVQTASDDFIYATQDALTTNIDDCLAIINSIKKTN